MAASNLTISHSSIQAFKSCPRKWWFAHHLHLTPEREAGPLRFGKAYHSGLDALAQGRTLDEALAIVAANYRECPTWADPQEWDVEAETVLRLVCAYQWRWQNDELRYVASETRFEVPIRNPKGGTAHQVRLSGVIDAIATLPDGRLAIVEHKTTSDAIDPASDYWRRLRIDQQISLYMLAARACGHDVQTVLYDVVKKPGIKPKLLTAAQRREADLPEGTRETPHAFGERLLAEIIAEPDRYFARQEIARTDNDLAEAQLDLWQFYQAFRESRNAGRYYRNTSQCQTFGRCPFLDPCSSNWQPTDLEPAPMGFTIDSRSTNHGNSPSPSGTGAGSASPVTQCAQCATTGSAITAARGHADHATQTTLDLATA